jgi:tRNA (guanine37-N1)-methyltransferase
MRIDIVSIFPEVFAAPLATSMVGIAREKGILDVRVHDLRDWTTDRHRQVDDTPYGGGPGMVMKPEPLFRSVADLKATSPVTDPTVILVTPQGRRFDQPLAEQLAVESHLIMLCGRYEGFDERIRHLADMEISIGDYVLTGGELPALVVVDAVTRLLAGVLGSDESAVEESFSWRLLEYPQYTRPAEWEGMRVPDILLSGDHSRIARWRRLKAVERTARRRPDLLETAELTYEERALAREIVDDSLSEDP